MCYFHKENNDRRLFYCIRSTMAGKTIAYENQQRSQSFCLSVGDVEIGILVSGRGQFKAQDFLVNNNMCGVGHLVGAFEFTCSTPDGADPKNPERPCPELPAAEPDTSTSSDNTTQVYSGTSSNGSFLQAIANVVLLHVLLLV